MKIVTAFDSFKGCMTAAQACCAAQEGIRQEYPHAQVVNIPLSDGGEGLIECISQVLPVSMREVTVHGPLMMPVTARYAISTDGETAYMEMAQAAGLTLVPLDKRNPMLTTTYGVGEMILDAVSNGCRHIIMGIGGSATCDGGMGMVDCLQEKGIIGLQEFHVTVASDVSNPLCGELGAAHVFGPQKGATPEQVILLDERLRLFAAETAKRGTAPLDLMDKPGAGAAGGLGYGLMAYLNARICSGIELVLDTLDFDSRISGADLVITGEGKSDRQTLMGKVAAGVLAHTQKHGIQCALLSGQIEDQAELLAAGFAKVRSIHEGDNRPNSELMKRTVSMQNIASSVKMILSQLDY